MYAHPATISTQLSLPKTAPCILFLRTAPTLSTPAVDSAVVRRISVAARVGDSPNGKAIIEPRSNRRCPIVGKIEIINIPARSSAEAAPTSESEGARCCRLIKISRIASIKRKRKGESWVPMWKGFVLFLPLYICIYIASLAVAAVAYLSRFPAHGARSSYVLA